MSSAADRGAIGKAKALGLQLRQASAQSRRRLVQMASTKPQHHQPQHVPDNAQSILPSHMSMPGIGTEDRCINSLVRFMVGTIRVARLMSPSSSFELKLRSTLG